MPATQIHGGRQIQDATITGAKVTSEIIRANGANAFTADQSMGGFKLTNLGTPTGAADAVTKAYADALRNGITVKDPVRVATTANITLSGTQTIDGVALSVGNRVLVKDQTTGSQNGIYVVAAGAWARAEDANTSAEVVGGMAVWVNEGTTNGDKRFVLTTNDTITLDTTALVFTQDLGGSSYTAGAGLTLTGSTFNIVAADSSLTVNADDIAVNLNASGGLEVSTGVRVKLDGASLSLSASGLRLNTGKFVTRETPTGALNGTNTGFTLAATPVVGTEQVYLNGILQDPGAGNDYTISGTAITMLTAPLSTDKLRVSYIAQ